MKHKIPEDERLRHEEEVASFLSEEVQSDLLKRMRGLKTSEKIILLYGELHLMFSNLARSGHLCATTAAKVARVQRMAETQVVLEDELE